MLIENFHTHTKRCHHAKGEDREYVEAAIRSGKKVLGISDHCPWVFPNGYVSPIRMLPSEVDAYFDSFLALKKEYARDIALYIGFESEYIPELMEAQESLLAGYPVDFQILGEHFTRPEYDGFYTGASGHTKEELTEYIDRVIEGMETGNYLYLAHPDLLAYPWNTEEFETQYTRLCRYLKRRNFPVEINLLGVVEGRHYTSDAFLKIAAREGCSAIIGIDAHTPDRLCYEEGEAACIALAEQYNLPLSSVNDSMMLHG